jgi:serine/threonine protein kinase
MNNSTWQRAKAIFYEARGLSIDKRAAFLNDKCAGAEELRSEVEKLLASYDSGFLEETAFGAAEVLTESELQPGQVIGRYHINELIGSGGMGQVFLADDTELNRPVAFKVLHRDVAEDHERVRRFIQEARAASALNHPNILTIHEIGAFEGCRFIVSEYVEGETLRERMKKGITVAESVDITCQVAAALQAAHAAGIVHRDIKPENVMIRRDALVKVLDFGLAKLTEADDHPIDPNASIASTVLTNPGLVMGTVAYMSPEQARGNSVDSRTDLWSLGVVFHEMLTGKSPFEGESATDIITSILKTETTLPTADNLPPELQPICERALAKKRESRYQSAHDLLKDLQGERKRMEYAIETTPYVSVSNSDELRTQLIRPRPTLSAEYIVSSVKRHKFASVAASAVLVASAAIGMSVYRYNGAAGQPVNVNGQVIMDGTSEKDLKMSRFATSGRIVQIAISPDAKYIAYVTADGPGKGAIRLRDLSANTDSEIVSGPKAGRFMSLSFSPGSDQLLYLLNTPENEEVFRVSISGGTATKIADHTDGGASLSPDGRTIAFGRDRDQDGLDLVLANADGANERVLVHTPADKPWIDCGMVPAWAPDGNSLGCWLHEKIQGEEFIQAYSLSVRDGKMRRMSEQKWRNIDGAAFMPDGSLIIAAKDLADEEFRPAQLWLITAGGETKPITNDVAGYNGLSATRDGRVLVSMQTRSIVDLWKTTGTDVSRAHQVTSSGELTYVNWTPDGRFVFASTISGSSDLWLMNADGSGRTQLTRNIGSNDQPSMTRDGRYIVFMNRRDRFSTHIFRIDADGKNPKQLSFGDVREWTPKLSPDGKWVYYVQVSGDGPQQLCKVSIDGGTPRILARSPLQERMTIHDVSTKDGRILVESTRTGVTNPTRHVAIISPDGDPAEEIKSLPGSAVKFDLPPTARGNLRWTPDGRSVAFREFRDGQPETIAAIPANGKGKPKTLFVFPRDLIGYRWSYDGKELAWVKQTVMSDAILITNKGY